MNQSVLMGAGDILLLHTDGLVEHCNADDTTTFPLASASAQGVNDAQIASIVVTANQVDIDAGKLATSRSTNDEVKAFAKLMITDHTSVNKSATDLVAKLKVMPQDNPTSQSLKSGGDKNLAHLKTLKGAASVRSFPARRCDS